MPTENLARICLLIKEAGGFVYYQSKLANGVYALSEGRVDNTGLEKIFTYKFDQLDITGPRDEKFESDLMRLSDTCFINIEYGCLNNDRSQHHLISLLDEGRTLADIASRQLTEAQFKSLQVIAKDLKDRRVKTNDLFAKYCTQWGKIALEEIKAL